MSEILVNTIKKADGTGSITVPADTGTVLTTASSLSSVPGAVTEVDMWRPSTDYTGGATDLTANWERVDDSEFSLIGTGMTESSGIFTFPQTGKYKVDFHLAMSLNGSCRGLFGRIFLTTDNSTYFSKSFGRAYISRVNTNVTHTSLFTSYIFDVTNTTTHKVKFNYLPDDGETGVTIRGGTSQNSTFVTFIRLGDT